jgi:hypothetical protein
LSRLSSDAQLEDLSAFTTYLRPTIHHYEFTITPIVYGIARMMVAVIKEPKTASSSKKSSFKPEPEPELELEPELEQYLTHTSKDDVIHLYSCFI